MMRLMRSLVLAALPMTATLAAGCFDFCGDYFSEVRDIACGSNYFVEGALLYWTNSDCDYAFSTTIEDQVDQTRGPGPFPPPDPTLVSSSANIQYVQPDLGLGFRVGFGLHQPDRADRRIRLYYQWIETNSRGVVKIDANSPFNQIGVFTFQFNNIYNAGANKLTGQVKSRLQKAELQVANVFSKGKWSAFTAAAGVVFIDIDHQRNTTGFFPAIGNGAQLSETQKHGFTGGGAAARGMADIYLGDTGISLWAQVGSSFVMGKKGFFREGIASGLDDNFAPFPYFDAVDIPNRTCPIIGFLPALGAKFSKPCGCIHPTIKIALEYEHYVDILGYRVGLQQLVESPNENVFFGSIGYGGLTVEANIGF